MDNEELREETEYGGELGGGSRRSHRHRHHQSTRRHWFISPLWIGLVLEGFIIAGLAIWATLLQQENEAHYARENALGQVINEGKTELEGLKWEFNEYKNKEGQVCLPNLMQLKFDQVIPINKEYVRSAMFVLAGKDNKQVLEYKFVLKNTRQTNVTPLVDVVFFNILGNQIGVSRIGSDKRGRSGEVLEKGEVRSYDGEFELPNGVKPEYVMLKFKDSKEDK